MRLQKLIRFIDFFFLQNVLSSQGRCEAYPVGVQLFLLMFYPPKGLCKADTEGGSIVFAYVLFCVRKSILDFQFTSGFLPFWELENVSSEETLESKYRQLFLPMSYFGLENVYWTFNLSAVFCLFETLKMFYPPEGLCRAEPERGPIVFTFVLFWVRKRILDFQFTDGFLPF